MWYKSLNNEKTTHQILLWQKKNKEISIYDDYTKNYNDRFFENYYDKAKNLSELFYAAGLALTFDVMKIIQRDLTPIRGRMLLRLQKRFFKSSYDRYYRIHNNLIAHSMILIIHKVRKVVIDIANKKK